VNEGAIRHFSPLTPNDLDWVHAQEVDLHPFPWTRGNFADSLTAGHGAWLMRVDNERVGYAVVLKVLDEAHLLNISVARAAQGKEGHGSSSWRFAPRTSPALPCIVRRDSSRSVDARATTPRPGDGKTPS